MSTGAASIFSGPTATNIDSDPATLVSFDVLEHGVIQNVDVSILIVADPASPADFHPEDLVINLEHGGVDVQLTPSGLGTHSDFFDVTFDDDASNPFPLLGTLVGTFQPVGLLSAFDGLDVFGTWTLSIFDPFVPGEGANLAGWTLHVPEPGSLALVLLAMAGLGISRRTVSA